MRVVYFTEEAYDVLKNTIPQNMSRYLAGKEWLEEFFDGQEYMKESTIEVSLPAMIPYSSRLADDEKAAEDIANVKQIYGNMRNLTPLQATNPYLWTCLAHTVYRDYVLHRWFDSDKFDALSDEKKIVRLRSRFFATNIERSLNNNAISRLWWYGFVSYDKENRANPFHLTEILVGNTKFCTDFMQSHCCWNRTIGKGVLRAAKDLIPTLSGREGISGYYRPLKKYMNRYGAVSSLDFLSEDDIYNLAMDYFTALRKKEPIFEDDTEDPESEE